MNKKRQNPTASSIVIFGAGNIGRSFIGSIFSSNGWDVIFVDANKALVQNLNKRGGYPVIIKRNNQKDERLEVSDIRALHSSETDKIISALNSCRLCVTSVGQNALRFVVPQIAEAVKIRAALECPPLDVIIAENIRNGAEYFRSIFRENGLNGSEAGFIETSIGKMVPIMKAFELAEDPLVLHAEEYNTLLLDAEGFKNSVPELPQIKAVKNIAAWVDRKLFIHNLGHAAAAYLGFSKYPHRKLISEVITDDEIRQRVSAAMKQAAEALLAEYPKDFTAEALNKHIDDLIFRFANRALGDSVFRVGRDLYRKLSCNDRIIGAAALCLKYNLPCDAIMDVFQAALNFKAVDTDGRMLQEDEDFHKELELYGLENLLAEKLLVTNRTLISMLI